MNMQEFAALKVGDKIENHAANSGVGEVTHVEPGGVRISWGGTSTYFYYAMQGTAWMHWNKVVQHASDCSVHNGPALPEGQCDCGAT